MPIAGASGIVLFRFHVDEEVQRANPEWAAGLYDNPPVPEEDTLLPSLSSVMDSSAYAHLKPQIKAHHDATNVRRLSQEEVNDINSRPVESLPLPSSESLDAAQGQASGPGAESTPGAGTGAGEGANEEMNQDYVSRGLDSLFNITNGAFTVNHQGAIVPVSEMVAGPSAGSSVRARRQAKRAAVEAPGGAATPVPKRLKDTVSGIASEIVSKEVEKDLIGDSAFLGSL